MVLRVTLYLIDTDLITKIVQVSDFSVFKRNKVLYTRGSCMTEWSSGVWVGCRPVNMRTAGGLA
jgi:hypothetical protein